MHKISFIFVVSLILSCVVRESISAAIGDRKSDHNIFHSDGIIMNHKQSPDINKNSSDEKSNNHFPNLHTLNISNCGIENLSASNFWNPNLKVLIASHNRLNSISDAIFINTPAIIDINFAHNKFATLHSTTFANVTKLTTLSFAHNEIAIIESETFSTLGELESLDLSNNRIQSLDHDLFRNNMNLRELWLENNPIQRFDEQIFWPIVNLPSLMLYISCENAQQMDTSRFGRSFEWQINSNSGIVLKSLKSMSHMECWMGGTFTNLRHFNCSGNQLQNTGDVIKVLGSSIETLDLSANLVGKINAHTFERFTNLKQLNLSGTQLANFGFNTFYHQRRLQILDIGYNQLKRVNFTLFFRVFRHLKTLNLEGNDLFEVDSVTKAIFSKLTLLGISKNYFTCDYLSKFLSRWENLKLIDNPSSNQMHIDGIDCFDDDDNNVNEASTKNYVSTKFIEQRPTINQLYRTTKPKQTVPNVQYLVQGFNPAIGTWNYQNVHLSQYGQRNSVLYPIYYYTN